jgi:hypothetical protein
MTPHPQWYINREIEEMDEAYYYIFHNDEFFAKCPSKEIADMVVAACSRKTSTPATPEHIDVVIGNARGRVRADDPTFGGLVRSPTPAPEKEVLDLLKKKIAWGKKIDKNHLFDYHNIEQMIEEAEQRVESLRTPSTQEHERGDQR